MSTKKKVLLAILIILLIVIASAGVYAYYTLNQVFNKESSTPEELSVNENLDEQVVNIALFGVDGRDGLSGDRSDTIMIASFNVTNGTFKLTSILRDTYVEIPASDGREMSYEKINHSYAYGGAELAMKTLNLNFDLNIQDYVVVDFESVVDIVDTVGGIEVNITDESVLNYTNQYIEDVNKVLNRNSPALTTTGVQTVDGVQALAFSRNRYSDSDVGRASRQREVVDAVIKKVSASGSATALSMLTKLFPYVETSYSVSSATNLAMDFYQKKNITMSSFSIPADSLYIGALYQDVYYNFPNSLADNAIILHKFLYGDDVYEPSEQVMAISQNVAAASGGNAGITIDRSLPYDAFASPNTAQDTYITNP